MKILHYKNSAGSLFSCQRAFKIGNLKKFVFVLKNADWPRGQAIVMTVVIVEVLAHESAPV